MSQIQETSISEFNYTLPEDRIAKFPLENRDSSKLLIYNNGKITDSIFSNAHNHLPENSILIGNNTKVIHARIEFFKESGARIEIFCLEPHQPVEYQQNLAITSKCSWHCIVGNSKKWKTDSLFLEFSMNNSICKIEAKRLENQGQESIIEFNWNTNISFGEILESIGKIPIPPYLNRRSSEIDSTRYQTSYAMHDGSVAAPTAGLHFTPEVTQNLSSKGITQDFVTLHVGAGTFKPVSVKNYKEHAMHREFFSVKTDLIQKLISASNIVAIGTTSVRTLESLYWLGVKLIADSKADISVLHQWDAYNLPQDISLPKALTALNEYATAHKTQNIQAYTQIMIIPGYSFRVINQMFTNFHQPQSTLLLLVCAFIGNDWKQVYEHALTHNYRFLSYGDSSLLFKKY